jgi:hypothetical protein
MKSLKLAVLGLLLRASMWVPWKTPGRDPIRRWAGGLSYRDYVNIKGRLKNGRYIAPLWGLSCAVPDLLRPGSFITDAFSVKDEENLLVFFTDDMGNAYGIRGWKSPGLGAGAQEAGEVRINEVTLNLYRRDLSNAGSKHETLHQEQLGDGSVFAVLQIPGGSNLSNSQTGQRLDSTLGCQVKRHGDLALIVTAQQNELESMAGNKAVLFAGDGTVQTAPSAADDKSDPWQSLRTKCLQFGDTITMPPDR